MNDAMAGLGAAPCPVNWRAACTTARKERLNRGMLTLASWAQSRAMGEHDDETTLTMLERKTAELRSTVNKAGWDAVAAAHSPNMNTISEHTQPMPSDENLAIKSNIGPHVSITERSEKLVCTRCDFLKYNLIRSGIDPQWECLCLHPRAKEVNEAMPGADRCWSTNGAPGCWIGEQPDTPEWCPLLKQNL